MRDISAENQIRFDGLIDSIRYIGDGGFTVLSVRPIGDSLGMNLVTVTGTLFEPHKKDKVEVEGIWFTHPRFGLQIKALRIQLVLPDTKEGVYALLKSKKFLPGIGAKTARVLSDQYGTKIFDILENNPKELLSVRGISTKKLEKIILAYAEKKEIKQILQFCAVNGIPQGQGEKIYEAYGGSAVSILSRNPYLLTETNKGIKGIGFKKADAIAMTQGIPKDSKERIVHGLLYEVNELTAKKGSTAVSKKSLVQESAEMMGISPESVEKQLSPMLESGKQLILDNLGKNEYIWDTRVYNREQRIADKILFLRDAENWARLPHDHSHAVDVAEVKNGIRLADSQREALETTLNNKFSIITGGPGVGKTTITRCLISILEAERNRVVCAAPTGRAAKRMSEATGHGASTIHRLLEVDPETGGFKRNRNNLLDGSVFIFDESSMIDTYIMDCLLDAIPENAMVVFIGDVDQLPSVGAGKVLEDMIRSQAVAVSRLKTIFRQAATSKIITVAHDVNAGKMPDIPNNPDDDFFFIEADNYPRCASIILKLADYIPQKFNCDPFMDVQVLSPKKASEVGTERLNMLLQEQYNPEVKLYRAKQMAKEKQKKDLQMTSEDYNALRQYISTPMIMTNSSIFAPNDKVMQIVNNYGKTVFNGEVGIVRDVYPDAKKEDICIVVEYPDENQRTGVKSVGYTKDELCREISLAYACTIHKSQGSEYKYVIIPVMPTFSIMLQRKLIYTGITRGKKMVIMVGSKESFKNAITNHFRAAIGTRHTKLQYWLEHPFEITI